MAADGGGIAQKGAASTLLVRHLPTALPADTLKRLFSHYGASNLRPCVAGRLKNCAFVDFPDESLAARAQAQLHRLKFLGKILSVERARPQLPKDLNLGFNPPPPPYPPPKEEVSLPHRSIGLESKAEINGPKGEPIAPGIGVDYPFPPHLEYSYPPPDGNILTNIVNTLIAVPRFYTQVLHLMNKMNLPAPFRPALPALPLPCAAPALPPAPGSSQKRPTDQSSSESELESSEDEDGKNECTRKRRKMEPVLGPAADKGASHEAAGIKSITANMSSVTSIKKKQPILQFKIATKVISSEDVQETAKDESDSHAAKDIKDQKLDATREELLSGKMPAIDILAQPMFKNYSPGQPSQVLYIKNLAKEVVADDLYHIFGAFFANVDDARTQLNVKLMQEGRMRGQAFVTFPSVEQAEDALVTVHGFLLKSKPMIVQFGRNPSAAK